MRKRWKIFKPVFLMICVITFFSCENPNESKFEPRLVLNGELIAGQPIDAIYMTWSADITEKYDTDRQRVRNAVVHINGVRLLEYTSRPGVYYYPDPEVLVEPGETYKIEVRKDEYYVFSQTTVPFPLQMELIGVSQGDTVQYLPGNSWFSEEFFSLTWPNYEGSQIFRIISLAENDNEENFIRDDRLEANIAKGNEDDRLNPAIWWVAENYARINWMYFNWTGWHDIIVSAVDQNYYQYRNGLLFGEQNGQNFNSTVRGGYGLFFSSASDTLRIFLVE